MFIASPFFGKTVMQLIMIREKVSLWFNKFRNISIFNSNKVGVKYGQFPLFRFDLTLRFSNCLFHKSQPFFFLMTMKNKIVLVLFSITTLPPKPERYIIFMWQTDYMIVWCLTPFSIVFQLYRPVHLSMPSWSSCNQYSTQHSFQATKCFPT